MHSDFVPQTAENFLGLCKRGDYDGVGFHRLIPGEPHGVATQESADTRVGSRAASMASSHSDPSNR